MSDVPESAQDPVKAAGEILRLALPLMSKHKIAMTPANYSVWYAYIGQDSRRLCEIVDQWLGEKTVITEAMVREVYELEVSECNEKKMERARETLQHLISDLQSALMDAGTDVGEYGTRLDAYSERLREEGLPLAQIREIVGSLVDATEVVKERGDKLQDALEASRKEIDGLRQELARARKNATKDALTNLANRGVFESTLSEAVQASSGGEEPFSLVMLDIDHFKRVNDTFGHLLGDKVIRYVAAIMEKCTKRADLAARYGGEEFALILPRTGLSQGVAVAEGIRRAVENGKLVRGKGRESIGVITISAGVAEYRRGESEADVIERADQALYRSKNAGRNRTTTSL